MTPIAALLVVLAAFPALVASRSAPEQVAFAPVEDKPWLGADYGDDRAGHAHTPFSDPRERFDGNEVWRIDYSALPPAKREAVLSFIEETVGGLRDG